MSHNYLNKNRTQELINTIRGHLSDIATVLSNLASGDARDNTKAPINHNQAANTITAMTGYSKPQATSAITASDTLNEAIGKLEKGLDDAGGGGETIPPIVINKMSATSTGSVTQTSGYETAITIDPTLIDNHPIKFKLYAASLSSTYVSVTAILNVEIFKHGKNINEINGSSISYTDYTYFMSSNIMIGGGGATWINGMTSTNPVPIALTSSMFSNIPVKDNTAKFYVTVTGSSKSKTVLDKIEPIDFTAVTRITHGGVTVWQRT